MLQLLIFYHSCCLPFVLSVSFILFFLKICKQSYKSYNLEIELQSIILRTAFKITAPSLYPVTISQSQFLTAARCCKDRHVVIRDCVENMFLLTKKYSAFWFRSVGASCVTRRKDSKSSAEHCSRERYQNIYSLHSKEFTSASQAVFEEVIQLIISI